MWGVVGEGSDFMHSSGRQELKDPFGGVQLKKAQGNTPNLANTGLLHRSWGESFYSCSSITLPYDTQEDLCSSSCASYQSLSIIDGSLQDLSFANGLPGAFP